MAQSCATFGFNPNLVPSASRSNLRAQQASPTQGSSGSESLRTSNSTNPSVHSAWEVLIIERFSQDIISWDLDRITVLRNTLRDWVMMDIPLSKIGRYLELILYNNDEHMKGRLTEMVNSRCRHIRIALDILQYYQIRDDQQKPLWLPRGQDYGDWYSIAGVPNAAANAAAFDETRRRARIVDVNSTPPGPHPAMRDQDLFDASTTAPTSGPQLLMYHHANPSVGRVGRFIDQEGNIVLMQPHLWS